ncbi:MAG: type II toxin-antitoxin system RelE/ParE family toxin [Firmicutes bacterium]|nr:type II toxin-antitoxin system RelE/ParE family toxin [Bacillota bacterium]
MSMWKIEYYEKDSGESPVEKFIDYELDDKLKKKAIATIDALKMLGNRLGEPKSKHLEDGIFELRIQFSTNHARVLYFFYTGSKIILTNGFVKKTNKVPRQEIEKAKIYREDYKRRYEYD